MDPKKFILAGLNLFLEKEVLSNLSNLVDQNKLDEIKENLPCYIKLLRKNFHLTSQITTILDYMHNNKLLLSVILVHNFIEYTVAHSFSNVILDYDFINLWSKVDIPYDKSLLWIHGAWPKTEIFDENLKFTYKIVFNFDDKFPTSFHYFIEEMLLEYRDKETKKITSTVKSAK